MLCVFRHKPLVTALTLWLQLCLVVVPLSAQNILVMPIGMSGALHFRGISPATPYAEYLLTMPFRLPFGCYGAPRSQAPGLRPDLGLPAFTESALSGNCRRFTEIKKEDPGEVRRQWQEFLGFDVWYPYYKEKEIEGWVRQKFRVRIFRLKGEPQFNSKGFTYIFKSIF